MRACFRTRTPLACPNIIVSRTRWWRGAEETRPTGCPGERLSKQTLEGQTCHQPASFVHLLPPGCVAESVRRPLALCRGRLSTPATPAATLCPATPPAATATSAGSKEELLETEEAEVALSTRRILTRTLSTRGAQMTAASTRPCTTKTLTRGICPAATCTRPCSALPPTTARTSLLWGEATGEKKQRDGNPHLSYPLQPIRTKATERRHSHPQAPAPKKWKPSNPGKRLKVQANFILMSEIKSQS